MDKSQAQGIVERHLDSMVRMLGLGHWEVMVTYDLDVATDSAHAIAGRCHPDGDYNQAWIEIDPSRFDDEAALLRLLRHELFHVVLSPFNLFDEVVGAMLQKDRRLAPAADRVWTHAAEKAVINLERMYHALTTQQKGQRMSVKKVGKGYENVSKTGQKMSKKPLPKADAEAQLRAIEANKAKGAKASKKK